MDEKKSFGAYIRKKRQEAGLTQRQLADRLYVAESTVSKWERGMSYPDVAMIPNLCRELGISEHEFFTACDDERSRAQERDAKAWRCLSAGWRWFFGVSYAIAIVVCFLCNLIIFGRLDWFWIVLFSISLAFSFTNLPFLVKRNRSAVCLAAASGSLLLLLLACWAYAGGWWILGGGAITLTCLALPWCWWAIWRFYGRHMLPLYMAAFSLWVFLLLAVIRAFTGGDWLLGFAYPIAAFCVGYAWLYFAVDYWLPLGPWWKAAAIALLTAFAGPLGNTLSSAMMPNQKTPTLPDYFHWECIFTHESVNGFSWVNVLVFAILLVLSLILLAVALVIELRRRRQPRKTEEK